MQPHIDYKRDLAAQFSGETSVPISELGVIHDNPASAEAIYAAKESLVIEAEKLNESNGEALATIARMAMAMMDNKALSELDDKQETVRARFKNPARPSVVSQADAIVKIGAAIPGVAESDVALEELGFDEDQVARIKADREKAQAQALIQSAMQQGGQAHEATMYEIASIIKSFRSGKISLQNAITLFSTIGVDEQRARTILGDARDVMETVDASSTGNSGQPNQQSGQSQPSNAASAQAATAGD